MDAADSREQQLQSRVAELTKQNSKLKEQFEDLNSSCLDLKGQLEVQITQVSMLEARQKQHEQQTNEQAGRLRGKTAELESIGKQLQVRLKEAFHCSTSDRQHVIFQCRETCCFSKLCSHYSSAACWRSSAPCLTGSGAMNAD